METKKCPSCDKFMIEWKSNGLCASNPPQLRYDFKCACGHSEFSRFETLGRPHDSFRGAWEKANGE